MTITKEIELKNFEFWGGAKDFAALLTDDEFSTIEYILDECSNGVTMSETEINDFFWFDNDTIAEWLEYENAEEIFEERKRG